MNKSVVAVSTVLFHGHAMAAAFDAIAAAGASYIEPACIRGYVKSNEGAFSAG